VSYKIFIVAGEASGDLHGAGLVSALKDRIPQASFTGIGGEKMRNAGVDLLFTNTDLAVVGITEVLAQIIPIVRAFSLTVSWIRRERPDLVILIDYPEFNLMVAGRARKAGIPVFYYISPQVWAWRRGRVKKIRRRVDRMAVILPFEQEFFRSHHVKADFVGHPLVDTVWSGMSRTEFCTEHGLDPSLPLVGLVPGSRHGEVTRLFPVMSGAAGVIRAEMPQTQFVIPLAPTIDEGLLRIDEYPVFRTRDDRPAVCAGETYEAISASDVILATSGTVTLEAAVLGTPMVVTYRVSPVSGVLGRFLIHVQYASLVNLVAGREVVPELLQDQATPDALAEEVLFMLRDKARRMRMKEDLRDVTRRLGSGGAAGRAADLALEIIERNRIR